MSAEVEVMTSGAGFYCGRSGIARRIARGAGLASVALLAAACVTTPVTGRRSFNAMSVEDDKRLGAQAYAEVIAASKLADGRPEFAMVKRCADRLAAVADDPGFDWEVHLIDEPETVNAWCMPGGKMAVYTGILPVTEDETGLAVVMAHEIGHAVARHGTERISMEMAPAVVIELLGGENKALLGSAHQLLVSMPWGRKQELEADHIGLMYMARAGYDPREAVDFWKRMAAKSQGAPPEWLSTHPSDASRIAQIEDLLPEAMQVWQAGGGKQVSPRVEYAVTLAFTKLYARLEGRSWALGGA